MHTYAAHVTAVEQRLLTKALVGILPQFLACIEEVSLERFFPLRCARLFVIGRDEQLLEVTAEHSETEKAQVGYWRLRVARVDDLPSPLTRISGIPPGAITAIDYVPEEEALPDEDESIAYHSRVVLHQGPASHIAVAPVPVAFGGVQISVAYT